MPLEPGTTRDAARTRESLLSAARVALTRHGAQVSVEVIARVAGVSKGGLLHHFSSKNDLFLALVRQLFDAFDTDVERLRRQEPPGPGQLTRAYVRATCREHESDEFVEHAATLSILRSVEPVMRYASERVDAWRNALDSDGLAPSLVSLIVLATDGLAVASLYGRQGTADELNALEKQLVALVDHHEEFARLVIPLSVHS